MASIQIPDELIHILQLAATNAGCSKEDLVRDAIRVRLEQHSAAQSDFTTQQIERLCDSIAQFARTEAPPTHTVVAMSPDWSRRPVQTTILTRRVH